jgi:DNA-binding transcriptional regulator GbsR (MarR family)
LNSTFRRAVEAAGVPPVRFHDLRHVAQVYAAEAGATLPELMARLGISRGNASMTVRTLVEWGIVTKSHRREDRRDYYQAEQDVLTLFATVIRVRKRREVDPLLALVADCRAAVSRIPRNGADHDADRHAADLDRKLDDIDGFVRTVDSLAEHYLHAERQSIGQLVAALEAMR